MAASCSHGDPDCQNPSTGFQGCLYFTCMPDKKSGPVITVDQFMSIENLRNQGRSIRDIARQTSISRNKVRKVLCGEHTLETRRANAGKPARQRAQKTDPFKEYIRKLAQ